MPASMPPGVAPWISIDASSKKSRSGGPSFRKPASPSSKQEHPVTAPVLFETKADCLDVILNRPEEGNLITNEMGQEIARVLRDIGPETKLIRLRGNGAHFCKGRQAPQLDREKSTA